MSLVSVVSSVLIYPRMFSRVIIPVIPGSPMTAIVVLVPSIRVMFVMTMLVIGTFSVSTVTIVIPICNSWNSDRNSGEETE